MALDDGRCTKGRQGSRLDSACRRIPETLLTLTGRFGDSSACRAVMPAISALSASTIIKSCVVQRSTSIIERGLPLMPGWVREYAQPRAHRSFIARLAIGRSLRAPNALDCLRAPVNAIRLLEGTRGARTHYPHSGISRNPLSLSSLYGYHGL